MIIAVPADSPRISPLPATEAMDALLDAHRRLSVTVSVVFPGKSPDAVSCSVLFETTVGEEGAMVIEIRPAISSFVDTVIRIESTNAPYRAVTTAWPLVRAITMPESVAMIIPVLLLVHVARRERSIVLE